MDENYSVPDLLYHYQPLRSAEMMEWLEHTMLHDQLYFSSPASFNDPFDSKVWPSFDGTPEQKRAHVERLIGLRYGSTDRPEARQALEGALADPNFYEKSYRQFQAESIPTLGIFCLSELSDDILLWSHYADAHRGICLAFAASAMFPDLSISRVSYPVNNQYPNVNFFTASKLEQSNAVLLTKAKHWEYEREWRVIDTEGPGWHEINSAWLRGVIVGCSTPEARVAEIRRLASLRKKPLVLFRASQKWREFALSIDPL